MIKRKGEITINLITLGLLIVLAVFVFYRVVRYASEAYETGYKQGAKDGTDFIIDAIHERCRNSGTLRFDSLATYMCIGYPTQEKPK